MNYNYNYLFLDLIITILLFLIIPFVIFYKREKYYTKKQRTIILILNSVFIEIIYIIIQCCLIGDYTLISFAPAVSYYYINKLIWKKNRFSDKVKKSENKNIFNKIKLKSIILFIIFICLIVNVNIFCRFMAKTFVGFCHFYFAISFSVFSCNKSFILYDFPLILIITE